MIKFILGFIAIVLLALVAYTFTQSEKKAEHKVVKEVETKVENTQKVEQPKVTQPKVKKHISVKEDAIDEVITSQKSVEISDSVESSDEIGKDLTLEGIENANVSDEEKARMRDDLTYYQAEHTEPSEPLGNEEVEKMMIEDLKLNQN